MTTNQINTEILDGLIVGRVEPHIYAFTTETVPNYLKVGDTYRPVEIRLDEWRKHFPNLKRIYDHIAKTVSERIFRDYSVHQFLENERHRARLTKSIFPNVYFSNEFFEKATKQDVEDAIDDINADAQNNSGKYQFYDENRLPQTFTYERKDDFPPRPNQQQTISNFKKAVKKGRKKLLMYAVMRFGKSFTSMCCADEIKAAFVVVVSAKADVKEEWKKTVESHHRFKDYLFATSQDLKADKELISNTLKQNKRLVLFLTLQDLQGDNLKQHHAEVFTTKIDLLLVDESHFGARATEYGRVLQDFNLSKKQAESEMQKEHSLDEIEGTIKVFNPKVTMHLSGTPYRILMSSEFEDEDIVAFYQFSDIADDKQKWDNEHLNDDNAKEWDNPYYGFPQMVRFAFNPSQTVVSKLNALKNDGFSYAMTELLRPKSISKDIENNAHKEFVHEAEVFDLFQVIDGSKADSNVLGFLDFDKIKQGGMCRHIVCVLPFRASCDALENLLTKNKDNFKNLCNYQIINIAGLDGDKNYKTSQSVKQKIAECEGSNQKTITLTVNRMLTGSTVEYWDTMIYLKETESPQEYDQAIFRLQNQYIKTYGEGSDVVKFNMKPQTILVDFDIDRVFRMQEQKSQIYNVNSNRSGNRELRQRIQKELEISPIIVINKDRLRQVEPLQILDAVREYSRTKSVSDEATDIPADLSLLDNENIRAEVEKFNPIDARQGLEIKPSGDDDGIDVPKPKGNDKVNGTHSNTISSDEDPTKELIKKLQAYYARILFYAFLTDSKVESLDDIISSINNNENNRRICKNTGLSKEILTATKRFCNPFVLSKLDYKIQNINSLISDATLPPDERVATAMRKFGRLGTSEIVTPDKVADDIVKLLPDNLFDKKSKVLDIAAKQGEFATALYRRYGNKMLKNVYSLPTSSITYEFTVKVYKLLGMPTKNVISDFVCFDLIGKNKTSFIQKMKKMKLTTIIGNPPYQVMDGGAQASASPIYHEFIRFAKTVEPKEITMIMPARWYTGGKGLDEFRDEMLNDTHIKELHDCLNPESIFPNTNVRGGICYFDWNVHFSNVKHGVRVVTHEHDRITSDVNRPIKTEDCDVFIRNNESIDIVNKIFKIHKAESFENYVSSRKPFGLDTTFAKNNNFAKTEIGLNNPVKCYGKGWSVGYVERDEITIHKEWIDKWKLFAPYANNIGTELNDDNLISVIGKPKEVCTESYLLLGVNLSLDENGATNLSKYTKTKFLRLLHSLAKASQHATSKTYRFVPLQDFTSSSDIDWSKSIDEIDAQLYKKYNLSDEEIKYIENTIKEM